ncbi:acyltransferase [Geitlerinema sp. P-1104]|uniref:acyltransferase n=1 Tax=Geitlerinema sp. P-1104 TaxID=2546230 RepID=UPI001476A56F|nr:acyltransferase [Geitlerinema sp. P-1104]
MVRTVTQQLAQVHIEGFDLQDPRFELYQSNRFKRWLSILREFCKHRQRSRLYQQWHHFRKRGDLHINGELQRVMLLSKDADLSLNLYINLLKPKSSVTLYIGRGVTGEVYVDVYHANLTLFIGDGCCLGGLEIASLQEDDEILIGNQVHIGSAKRRLPEKVTLFSGGHSANCPFLVIGDDCLFSYGVTIRTTDAHPILDRHCQQQVNAAQRGVLIEPHVWVGQNASILKDVTVGACSVIALGAVVVKDIPRGSLAVGIPASHRSLKGKLWTHSSSSTVIARAQAFSDHYLGGQDAVDL